MAKENIAAEKEILLLLSPGEIHLTKEKQKIIDARAKIETDRIKAIVSELVKIGFENTGTEQTPVYSLLTMRFDLSNIKMWSLEMIGEIVKDVEVMKEKETERLAVIEDERKIEMERQEKIKTDQAAESLRLQKIQEAQKKKEKAFEVEQKRIEKENFDKQEVIRKENEAAQNKIQEAQEKIDKENARIETAKVLAQTLKDAEIDFENKKKKEEENKIAKEKLRILEEQKKAALAPDKEKLLIFANSLNELKFPEVNSKEAKNILELIKIELQNTVNNLRNYANQI